MIARGASTCLRTSTRFPRRYLKLRSYGCVQRRHSSSTSSVTASTTGQSAASPLASITSELDKLAPCFDVSADSIEIIPGPVEFYATLKINTIREALKTNPKLKVSILTDALRGTREAPNPSCASLLAPLIAEFGSGRVQICAYHTPNLTGLRKAILPKRINEGWGLQHMKLYGIDDEIIISGANLSSDYFTDRQDRYHVFKSKQITDYFSRVYDALCKLSYRVQPSDDAGGYALDWPSENVQPAPLINPGEYINAATKVLAPLMEPPPRSAVSEKRTDTLVYPLLQLTPLLKPDTSNELPALTDVLGQLSTPALVGSRWTFTAGYFNMMPRMRELLLASNPSSATILAASPWANGFYGSKGISGMLPAAYTLLSRSFLDAVSRAGLSKQITVREWRRGTVNTPGGWTYHAKGIWITLPGEEDPSISLVGSSNYTKRSYSLDLEANTMIVTRNADLRRRLGDEEKWLQAYSTLMTRDDYARTERRVGLHVRIAMGIVTLVGGAL